MRVRGVCVDRRLAWLVRARRAVFAVLAVLSTIAALALIYAAFGAETGLTPTVELVGIFVLLVFPTFTVWVWAWDRSIRKKALAHEARRQAHNATQHAGGRHAHHDRHETMGKDSAENPKTGSGSEASTTKTRAAAE